MQSKVKRSYPADAGRDKKFKEVIFMKQKFFRTIAVLVILVMTITLFAACGKSSTSSEKDGETEGNMASLGEYTIQAFFPGDTPNDFDLVLAEAERQVKDSLNVKLKFQFIPWSDYADKVKVKIAAGDDFDLHLNAPWMHMNQMISSKSIQAWDPYLEKYGQAVLKTFPEEMIDANKFDGKVMGIPLGNVLAGPWNLPIRKDLREKYGMEKPNTLETFGEYLRKVKENEKNMIPLTWNASQYVIGEKTMLNYMNFGQNNSAVYIHFNEEGGVEPIRPIYEDEKYLKWVNYAHKWYKDKLIDTDVLAQKDEKGAFMSGRAASANVDLSDETKLQDNVPGGEIEYVYFTGEEGQSKFVTDFKMWNFLCLNSKSKDPERVTKFYNWVFENQAHYDLFQYGIEGKHWVNKGDHTYDLPEDVNSNQNYNFPGYVFLWNPNFDRIYAKGSKEYVKVMAFQKDASNFVRSDLTGFSPNYENIKNEMAKVGAIWAETVLVLGSGLVDPEKELPNIKEKLQAAGYDKIVEEARKQVADFLASNKN